MDERGFRRVLPMILVAALIAVGCDRSATPATPLRIVIEGADLAPESVTSRRDGTLLIGDGVRGILEARAGMPRARTWASLPADDPPGIFGVFADEVGGTLWVCTTTLDDAGKPAGPPSMLHALDLASGAHRAHYELPKPNAFCNDVAVDASGTAYMTDTNNMEILRLAKGGKQLDFWAGNGAFGPPDAVLDGIAVLGDRLYVNALATGALFSVALQPDGSAGAIMKLTLDRGLDQPDGMRAIAADCLLVAEYGNGGRLSSIRVQGDHARIEVLSEEFSNGTAAVTLAQGVAWVLEYADEKAPAALVGFALPGDR